MQTALETQAQGPRNWDEEFVEALRAAQNAAGFEHVGLLSGLGLMPLLGFQGRPSRPTSLPTLSATPARCPRATNGSQIRRRSSTTCISSVARSTRPGR